MKLRQSPTVIYLPLCLFSISSTVKDDFPQIVFKEMLRNNLVPKKWQEYVVGNLYNKFMQKSHQVKNLILMLEKVQQKAEMLNNISHLEVYAEAKGTVVKKSSGILTLFKG